MYGNSSLMIDRDETFFGDQELSVKDSIMSGKDCTKNSSNPEKVYKELNSEITKAREGNISANSRTYEGIINDQLIDTRIWDNNNDETQDSNQYYKKFELLRKKERNTPTSNNKGKKQNLFIANNNYDYSVDTEEFGMANIREEDNETLNAVVNRISSMQIKNNNINQLDKKTTNYSGKVFTPMNKKIPIRCITEPDEYINTRPHFSSSFQNNMNTDNNHFLQPVLTPQKRLRDENRSMNFMFNNNIQNQMNFANTNSFDNINGNINMVPSFPQLINRSSVISNKSTHYSSNNKKKQENLNFEEGESVEYIDGISANEENFINLNFITDPRACGNTHTYFQSMSDKKVRMPTSESLESNNSSQFNYFRNHPNNLIGMNLNHQFSSRGNNLPCYFEEETRRNFSSSFNETNFLISQPNFDNAFSMNNNFLGNTPQNDQLHDNKFTKQKMNKHTKSENIYKIKIGTEKNVLNLEDILTGKDKRTTIMIRNIPIKYSDDMLLKELEEFRGKFDCLYLPFDYDKLGNRGYAFINFVHPFQILLFYEKFEGKTWNFFESKKICELNAAKFQGINEIKRHARNYKGEKRPSFFIILDIMANLELPMKYRNHLKNLFPNIVLEEGSYGVIKIKSFGK